MHTSIQYPHLPSSFLAEFELNVDTGTSPSNFDMPGKSKSVKSLARPDGQELVKEVHSLVHGFELHLEPDLDGGDPAKFATINGQPLP